MKALRKFLADTADLVLLGLRVLGARGPRWEFRRLAIRRRLLGDSGAVDNLRRSIRAEHKMCRECRALVPARARRCPECGASTRGVPRGGLSRLLALVFPGMGSVTAIVMSLNFALYVVSVVLSSGEEARGSILFSGPSGTSLFLLGGKAYLVSGAPLGPPHWQLYRLVMPNFLHGGLLHIAMNSLALMNLGPLAEHLVGRRRFVLIYATTGVAAFACSYLFTYLPAVGSSGALFGLMGFLIVFARLRGGPAGRALSQYLTTWALFGLVMLFIPGIDSYAHAGGFAAGAALGAAVRGREPRTRSGSALLSLGAATVVLIVLGSMAWVIADWPVNLRRAR